MAEIITEIGGATSPQIQAPDEGSGFIDRDTEIFKTFDQDRDVLNNRNRIIEQELYYPSKAIGKPWTGGTYTIEEVPAESGDFSAYNSPTFYLKNEISGTTYASCMRGESGSYTDTDNSITYRYMVNLTQSNVYGDFVVSYSETSPDITVDKLDILTIPREFSKDGLDPKYFGIAIDGNASASYTDDYGAVYDNANDGLVGLFPLSTSVYNQNIGANKHYLYRLASGTFYDSGTDTFTVPDDSSLDTSTEPFGEMYPALGIVILYINVLLEEYPALVVGDNLFNYVSLIGGNSMSSIHSDVFFVRLENTEFNITTNPTAYQEDNSSIPKPEFVNDPKTFPTTVGFHNSYGQLIAVGKLSKPFEKNSSEEAIIRAEMGY